MPAIQYPAYQGAQPAQGAQGGGQQQYRIVPQNHAGVTYTMPMNVPHQQMYAYQHPIAHGQAQGHGQGQPIVQQQTHGGMLRPGVQGEGAHHHHQQQQQTHPGQGQQIQVHQMQVQGGGQGQQGIPMVLITQDGQRMMMPAMEWHRMQQQPHQNPHVSPGQGAGGGGGGQPQQHIASNGIIGYASPQSAASVGMPVGSTPRMMMNGNPNGNPNANPHGNGNNPNVSARSVTPTPIPGAGAVANGGRPIPSGYTQLQHPHQQQAMQGAHVPMGMAGQMAMVPSGMQLQPSHLHAQGGQVQGGLQQQQGFAVVPGQTQFAYQQSQQPMYVHHPSPRFTQHPPTPTTTTTMTTGSHAPPLQNQQQPVRPTITIPNSNGNVNGNGEPTSSHLAGGSQPGFPADSALGGSGGMVKQHGMGSAPPPPAGSAGGQASLVVNGQGGQAPQNHTPVFKTPQPPHLLPPSWNTPSGTAANTTTTAGAGGGQGMVGSSPSGGSYHHNLHLQQQQVQGTPTMSGLRTPASAVSAPPNSAGPGPGPGKISFLPPRALMGHQPPSSMPPPPPNQYAGQQGFVNGHSAGQVPTGARIIANGGPGPVQLGTPSAPIDIDGSAGGGEGGGMLLAPFTGGGGAGRVPSTPVYRVASSSTAGTPARGPPAPMSLVHPPGTAVGAGQSSLALLNMQGMMSPAAAAHAQQHAAAHQQQQQQIVYLPNGQPMVVVQQPQAPASQDPHNQAHLGMQMQEWRQGLMTPMEEPSEMDWASSAAVVDVGACLMPGEASSRLSEFIQALQDAATMENANVWSNLVKQHFREGAMLHYQLTHQGNKSPKTFEISQCSIARWFSTAFDMENVLVAVDVQDPVEEYVFTDYNMICGIKLESHQVSWVYRNSQTGFITRTQGWLRAIMMPDFELGVLKFDRLEVYYQATEEYVPPDAVLHDEEASKLSADKVDGHGATSALPTPPPTRQQQDSDQVKGKISSPANLPKDLGDDKQASSETLPTGFKGFVSRQNVKLKVDNPAYVGPYGVTEKALRFLELSTTMLTLYLLMERSKTENFGPRATLKRTVEDMRVPSADSVDSGDTKSSMEIGTPASALVPINSSTSYLGGTAAQQEALGNETHDLPETSGAEHKFTASPVPVPPKTKQSTTTPLSNSAPPSGSAGTFTALPSPSRKAMPPPKLIMGGLKRKNPSSAVTLSHEMDEARPSKKTAPSPKPKTKKEKARSESLKSHT